MLQSLWFFSLEKSPLNIIYFAFFHLFFEKKHLHWWTCFQDLFQPREVFTPSYRKAAPCSMGWGPSSLSCNNGATRNAFQPVAWLFPMRRKNCVCLEEQTGFLLTMNGWININYNKLHIESRTNKNYTQMDQTKLQVNQSMGTFMSF